jgi:hypothetical protein
MRSLLIGGAASQAEVAAIRAALLDGPTVRRLIHLRTLQLGPDELLVGVKVELDPALSPVEVAEAIDEAERRVRARVPSARVIYLESDCYRPGAPVERASTRTPDPEPSRDPGRLLDRARCRSWRWPVRWRPRPGSGRGELGGLGPNTPAASCCASASA